MNKPYFLSKTGTSKNKLVIKQPAANEAAAEQEHPVSMIRLSANRITTVLFTLVAALCLIHIVTYFWARAGVNAELVRHVDYFFNLNKEYNFPTYFSYSLLLFASLLQFILFKLNKAKAERRYWLLLSITFLFLSLDEALVIHERVDNIARTFIHNDLSGYFLWAWIIPYSILFLAIGIYLLRFLFRLPAVTRNQIFLSWLLLFLGAVGLESVEGHFEKVYGSDSVYYFVTITVQECLEMCGEIVFIHALLQYLQRTFRNVGFSLASNERTTVAGNK